MPEFQMPINDTAGKVLWRSLDTFTRGYIEAMFFADMPENETWELSQLSLEALQRITKDCNLFRADTEIVAMIEGREEEAGRDFWYTSQGHGVGFWDGDWPEHGGALTARAETFDECYPYLGDDGAIYL